MGDTVRWGVLGTGKIARIVAEALTAARDAQLVCVGSRDPSRAAAFAAGFGAVGHAGYEDVVADPAVDVVYVALPHPAHRAWAVRAADAGKHVLCEKPMAVTGDDAVAIVGAARRNDVLLVEAFAYRSHPQTHRLVALIQEGRVGELRMIDATFGYDAGPAPTNYLLSHELAGGGILDVGCYPTSMAHLLVAAARGVPWVETVDVAGAGTLGPTGVDLSAAATLAFDDGILARVACSIQANLDGAVGVVGSEGRIMVVTPWLPGRIGRGASIVLERWGTEPEVFDVATDADVYTIEVDAVNDAVRRGERSTTIMPWEDSLANMRTLDRWRTAIGLRFADDER
jgi:predicted dehydrogenase